MKNNIVIMRNNIESMEYGLRKHPNIKTFDYSLDSNVINSAMQNIDNSVYEAVRHINQISNSDKIVVKKISKLFIEKLNERT